MTKTTTIAVIIMAAAQLAHHVTALPMWADLLASITAIGAAGVAIWNARREKAK
ncbi:hypothetical protein ACX3T3_03945 [Actinotignum schaalii]|uniref:hypothetical protein n=1 Tax=Actinotignum TaxID=1653174 RepID=UPI00237E8F7E|nr:hypothetical protein [Actinotignum sanguinis]MDE1552233.1 hypothetical protein [Actinotignum sanguinis]